MEKGTRISYIGILGFFVASILHNVMYAFGWTFLDVGFFLLSLILLLIGLLSLPINLIGYFMRGKPKDIWKLGWLGFLGIAFAWMTPYSMVLLALFGFFLLKFRDSPSP